MVGGSLQSAQVLPESPGSVVEEMIQHRLLPVLHVLLGEGADEEEDPDRSLPSPVVRRVAIELVAGTQTSSEETGSWGLVQPAGEPAADSLEVALYPFHECSGEDLVDDLVVGQQLTLHQIPGGDGV